jgi:hypothetical protein
VALGAELLGVSFVFGAVVAHLSFRRLPMGSEPARWVLSRLMIRGIGTLPLIIGGASVLVEAGGGLYWIAGGIIGAIAGSVANAWVLLVEILR